MTEKEKDNNDNNNNEIKVMLARIETNISFLTMSVVELKESLKVQDISRLSLAERVANNDKNISVNAVKSERAFWTAVFSGLGAFILLIIKVFT